MCLALRIHPIPGLPKSSVSLLATPVRAEHGIAQIQSDTVPLQVDPITARSRYW